MRRRDFTIGLLCAGGVRTVRAEEPAKEHRIAIAIPAGPVALIGEGDHLWRAFFEELRNLGDVEGQNLRVERYSGAGQPEGFADLAHKAINQDPDVIVAETNPVALAVRAASATIPIVWIGGEPVKPGFANSLARPGGSITGVTGYFPEIWGKRLQILKEVLPSASKTGFLALRGAWEGADGRQLREAGRQLEISVVGMTVQESNPSEYKRAFGEIARNPPDAIIVSSIGDLLSYRQLIVELAEKSRLPAIYPWRDYVEAGGLIAYGGDLGELGRRMADDVHQILNGTKPGDIPIYQPTRYEFLINLKAAKALDLTFPPALLATADEIIE